MAITIYDIANRANVSIATVSRVFNNHERVSEGTRNRVLAVAKELGYQPHASAQSLARQKTNLVSAVVPMLTNYFFLEVLRGLQDRLAETGYDLIVYSTRTMEGIDDQIDRSLQRGRSAGVLIFSTPITLSKARELKKTNRPIVLVDSFNSLFDSVSIDNEQGGRMATRLLLEKGCSRIGLIAADPDSEPSRRRQLGYEQALLDAGLSYREDLVVHCVGEPDHGFNEDAGDRAMTELLSRPDPPDAVFVVSDVQALGAIRAARRMGKRVPEDLLIVGFDDIQISRYVGLTTLRQPRYEMGRSAIDRLLTRIAHPNEPVSHTVFTPELQRRYTCGTTMQNGYVRPQS